MEIYISKTNYKLLCELIDKAVAIIQQGNPSNREYNIARRLRLTKNAIVRSVEKANKKK
jgi:hypothetical protein